VVKGTSGTIYSYDELGNLLSVGSGSTLAAPPIIDTINPDVLFIGSKLFVKIEGQNFLSTESVITDNSALIIKDVFITDSAITAELSVATSGVPGPATITVNNSYGSAGIGITISDSVLRLSPGQLAIVPGATGNLTASIDPPLFGPLTLTLKSSNPAIVSVPETVTIPATGTETVHVYGNQEGTAVISAGDSRSVVFVSAPFSGEVSGLTGGRVSAYIEDSADEPTTGKANPVSVLLYASASSPTTDTSAPVSVVVDSESASVSAPTTDTSAPVSVFVNASASAAAIEMAAPVSVVIDTPSEAPSISMSLPVSVEIQ
jgi:hypothetical protein